MEKTKKIKAKKYNLMKKTPAEYVLYSIVFAIFCFFAASYVYMLFWCFYSGTRAPDIVVTDPFGFSKPNFGNYIEVFRIMDANGAGFVEMLLNSLYFSIFGCAISIMVTTMFAYVCNKYTFPCSKLFYMIIIVITMLPIYGSGSGMYKMLFNLGFLNSPLMLLTSIGGFNMNFLYLFAFFSGLSWNYAEAAQIDGANDWQVFFQIMFPQSIAMVGSLYVLAWLAEWNSYGTALIYLPKMPTLAVGIYQFQQQMQYESRYDILYAACAISIIPPLTLFVLCNNALMSNISLGGIKE
jgi:ABC-type glycerol-3-phosphate transport system permease component